MTAKKAKRKPEYGGCEVTRILNGYCPKCVPLTDMQRYFNEGDESVTIRQLCPTCGYRITGTPRILFSKGD